MLDIRNGILIKPPGQSPYPRVDAALSLNYYGTCVHLLHISAGVCVWRSDERLAGLARDKNIGTAFGTATARHFLGRIPVVIASSTSRTALPPSPADVRQRLLYARLACGYMYIYFALE